MPRLKRRTSIQAAQIRTTILGQHSDAACAVAFSPDGDFLLTGDFDGGVKLWRLQTPPESIDLDGHQREACAAAFDFVGQYFATGSWDKTIHVYTLPLGKRVTTIHSGDIKSLSFVRDDRLVSSDLDGELRMWSIPSAAQITERKLSDKGLTSTALSPDKTTLAAAGYDGALRFLNVESFAEKGHCQITQSEIFGLAYFPDGRRIAVAEGEDYGKPEGMRGQNEIVVLDVDTCTELHRMSGHESIVYTVALSPDGSTIASGAADNTIRLWNVDGSSLAVLRAPNSRVHAVAFHPNGQELASASGNGKLGGVPGPDNTVRLWTWEQQ